jgi:hypothetical protein
MESGGRTKMRTQKSAEHAQAGMTWLKTRCSTANIMESAGVMRWLHTQLASLSLSDMLCRSSVSLRECHSVNCLPMLITMTYADTSRLMSAHRSAWYATCMHAGCSHTDRQTSTRRNTELRGMRHARMRIHACSREASASDAPVAVPRRGPCV